MCAAALALVIYLTPNLFQTPAEEIIWVNHDPEVTDYDVIVIGGEPEGVAAAVAAARNGMNTLLLEKSYTLGGLMTLGKLNYIDMCYGRDGTLLTRGIFEEFYNAVDGTAFDIIKAKNYFIDLVAQEPLLTLRTQSVFLAPLMEGNRILGVRMIEEGSEVTYTARRIIDATADGDVAAFAGAPYTYGGEDIGEKDRSMGVTLVFELSGVNWFRVFLHLNAQRLKGIIAGNSTGVGATNKIAWGYEQDSLLYIPNDPMVRLRGLNIARQDSGTVLINALVIFGVEPLDNENYLNAIDRANTELTYLLPFIRENYAGFANAELMSTADRLYVRETRHIMGQYRLSIDDVLENRDQWDKIAIGGYPADVQPSILQPFGTVIGSPDRYAVPFRSLVPINVDNLLIIGRSASYTSMAASSARVIPLGMACGQAAGAAAAQSISDNCDFRQMSSDPAAINKLQSTLKTQGAYLDDFDIAEPIMSHWAYEGLAALRRIGLMGGGYQNDYRLEESIDKWRFQSIINGVVSKAGYALDPIKVDNPPSCGQIIDAVTSAVIAIEALKEPVVASADGQENSTEPFRTQYAPFGTAGTSTADYGTRKHSDNLELLLDAGLLDPALEIFFTDSGKVPQVAEVAMLLANLYDFIISA